MARVPLLDLAAQYRSVASDIEAAIKRVLASQRFILGPEVEQLEAEMAHYCGTRFAVGVSSGSDALLISLMALGIGPGDAVLTTPYSFFATAGAIVRVGAVPLFADVGEDYNLDPQSAERALLSSPLKTRAVIPVHLFGQPARMEEILALAKTHGLAVIEDAAQAIGAECEVAGDVRRAGSMGTVGCFSFFPSKNLGCCGDGGLVTTSDEALAERLRTLRGHGARPKYYHRFVGGNFRLDALQAAILRAKLPYLDGWSENRRHHAKLYRRLLTERGLVQSGLVRLCPVAPSTRRHVYNQFAVRVAARDTVRQMLDSQGVGSEVYYPLPLHLQECFSHLGYQEGDLPEAEQASSESLALPIYPELEEEQITYVVDCLEQVLTQAATRPAPAAMDVRPWGA
ncbi:MAG: DegT/DnrJ/EryC1/StrS family aminotransferase [Pseudomonadota bacterium]